MAPHRKPGVVNVEPLPEFGGQLIIIRVQAYRPDSVCRDDSWVAVRYARQTAYVIDAWSTAQIFYIGPSILKHVGQDFLDLIKGILPGLCIAFGAVISTTAIGALIGGVAGGVGGGGVGAVPGAVYGGEIGFTIGMWLLEFLGLAVLVDYMAEALSESGQKINRGLKRAWNSCGSDPVIDSSAQEIGEGFGYFFDALFQALVGYIAEEGIAAAMKTLNESKLMTGIGNFLKSDTFKEATVSYWLKKLGKPGEPKLVRDRVSVVIEFVRDTAKDQGGRPFQPQKIREVLSGTDFNPPKAGSEKLVEPFKIGQKLTQRPDSKWGGGNWFSRPGFSAGSSGLAEGNRGYKVYEVLKEFEGLKTRASGINDTFTQGRTLDVYSPTGKTGADLSLPEKFKAGEFAEGRGDQFFAEKHVTDLVREGYLKEVLPQTPGSKSTKVPK